MARETYDAIVVGGGHNGLVAAAYLARSGAKTLVLEQRAATGGAATTEAPWPDAPQFKVTRLSYVMSLLPPTILNDLRLEQHGYKVFPMGPYYQAFPEGGSLALYEEESPRAYDEIAKWSKKDADAYPQWNAWLGGELCYPSLAALPEHVDLALLAVPDAALDEQVRAAAAGGARSAVIFGSAVDPLPAADARPWPPSPGSPDAEGALQPEDGTPAAGGLRERTTAVARDAGMAVCGAGCMGFVKPRGAAGHRVRRAGSAADRAGRAGHALRVGVLGAAADPARVRVHAGGLVRAGTDHAGGRLREVCAHAPGDEGARSRPGSDPRRARAAVRTRGRGQS